VVGGGIATIVVVVSSMLLWPETLRLGPLHEIGPKREGSESSDGVLRDQRVQSDSDVFNVTEEKKT
jgi:hypothetical protein